MLLCKPKTFYPKDDEEWEDWVQGQIDTAQE